MKTGRPSVRVKSAVSLDGRTALANGESQWISGEAARQDVQRWRARSSAILTGIGTVLADDPSMDARVDVDVVQPVKVIVDTHWRTPPDSKILSSGGGVVIAGNATEPLPPALSASGAECVPMPVSAGRIDLKAVLAFLAERETNEIQVEAGAGLCGSLLEAQLVDEFLLYLAPVLLGHGGPGPFAFGPLESMAERTHLKVLETIQVGKDLRIRLQPEYRH